MHFKTKCKQGRGVARSHPVDVFTCFFGTPSNSCCDISVWTKVVDWLREWCLSGRQEETDTDTDSKSCVSQTLVLSPRTAASQRTPGQPPQPTLRSLTPVTLPVGSLCVQLCQGHWHAQHTMINREAHSGAKVHWRAEVYVRKQTINLLRMTWVTFYGSSEQNNVITYNSPETVKDLTPFLQPARKKQYSSKCFLRVQLGAEIPGIGAILYLLSLYSSLGAWGSKHKVMEIFFTYSSVGQRVQRINNTARVTGTIPW